MILKGSQRSGDRQLAAHLLKADDNEHVEVHELRGFIADNLPSAFNGIHAISKGNRAKQPFFSLSLNPLPNERVPIEVFETAIEQIEQKHCLEDQPRAIVFHEKVPAGFIDRKDRNPLNFSREEWQQARRVGLNSQEIKRAFQESWAISDNRSAFAQALLSKGFVLARVDRRGYVAVDYQGEVYVVAKYTGVKTKEVRERLSDLKELPSIEQAKDQMASDMTKHLHKHVVQAEEIKQRRSAAFEFKRHRLVEEKRQERSILDETQRTRWEAEIKDRSQRLSKGLLGIWHRLIGKYEKTKHQNEIDALRGFQRDRKEKDALIFKHIQQRQQLNLRQRSEIHTHELEIELLQQDIQDYRNLKTDKPSKLKEEFRKASEESKKTKKPKREIKIDNVRGLEPDI